MTRGSPFLVRWTDHALEKADLFDVPRSDIEAIVIEQHTTRRRNHRAADWQVSSGALVIAYDHPDHGDTTTARVVTLWRRR